MNDELTRAKEGLINDVDKLISRFSDILSDNSSVVQEVYKQEALISSNCALAEREGTVKRQIETIQNNHKKQLEILKSIHQLESKYDECEKSTRFYSDELQAYLK